MSSCVSARCEGMLSSNIPKMAVAVNTPAKKSAT
jgi:hypothetical protein